MGLDLKGAAGVLLFLQTGLLVARPQHPRLRFVPRRHRSHVAFVLASDLLLLHAANEERPPVEILRDLLYHLGIWGCRFRVWVLEFGVWGLGFEVWCLVFGVWCLGFGVHPGS